MKVSIITVVYNNQSTISCAIESVLNQTYQDIEFIVIDGGSNDGTLEKISLYRNKIDVLISEPDGGIYYAMNKGLLKASGDIIGILNSDDFYSHHRIVEKIVDEFKKKDVEGIYGDLDYVNNSNTNKIVRHWVAGKYNPDSFLFGWMPPHPSFFVKKSVYNRYGTFNVKLRSAADYELMLRFIHKHQISISYFPEVLVKMRGGGMSNASFKNRLHANKEDRIAWELNGLKPYFFTLWLKPLRKIMQYILK